MDDSPQNNPGIQQKPTTENTAAYPQYPVPVPAPVAPPKKRPKILIIAAGVLAVLVILAVAVVLVQGKPGQSKGAVACTSDTCFSQHFAQCSPATRTYDDTGGSVQYTIVGGRDVGCTVTMKYIKANYDADMTGKTMTCGFDNRSDFQTAAQNVIHFPADYGCKGDLVSFFQS